MVYIYMYNLLSFYVIICQSVVVIYVFAVLCGVKRNKKRVSQKLVEKKAFSTFVFFSFLFTFKLSNIKCKLNNR